MNLRDAIIDGFSQGAVGLGAACIVIKYFGMPTDKEIIGLIIIGCIVAALGNMLKAHLNK